MPEYIIQLVCARDFNASNCTNPDNIREANRYIVNMSILNNVGSLVSIGPMIYFAENFGRKPVYAVVLFGVIICQIGIGLARTPLYVEIIYGAVGILVSVYAEASVPVVQHHLVYSNNTHATCTCMYAGQLVHCTCLSFQHGSGHINPKSARAPLRNT